MTWLAVVLIVVMYFVFPEWYPDPGLPTWDDLENV